VSEDPIRAIADAVLYEGYILWPYRRSALKNQRRFTFGGVYPPAHSHVHPDDPAAMTAQVLLRVTPMTRVEIIVRFLQVVHRAVLGPAGEERDELVVGGERYVAWKEAAERELQARSLVVEDLRSGVQVPIEISAGREREELRDGAGALLHSWHSLEGELKIYGVPVDAGVWRLSVEVSNGTPFAAGSREEALTRTFCSTHMLLRVDEGAFVSLTDPEPELMDLAAACRNKGTWPVLVGEPGERDTVLCSPIILEDYPRVAPESPGDLFDGGEIDQLLILNILALTDEEKAEMAATDPRAREILERTEALTPEQLMRLHGTLREFAAASGSTARTGLGIAR
jgi:hydrogenase maturation protease